MDSCNGWSWCLLHWSTSFETVRFAVRWLSYRAPAFPSVDVPTGGEDEGCGRRDVEVRAGPDCGSDHPKGLVRVALKALAHRPRPKGSPPKEQAFRENLSLYHSSFGIGIP